jgi:trans-aconitate methyltransferase
MTQVQKIESFAGLQTRLRGADTWVDDQPGSSSGGPTDQTDDRVPSAQINGIDREPGSVIDTGNSKAVSLRWE